MLPLWLMAMALTVGAQTAPVPFEYQSPRPAAEWVSRRSAIILRPGPLLDRTSLEAPTLLAVTGEISGAHAGRLVLAADERTIVFTPDEPFASGERVTVVMRDGLRSRAGAAIAATSFGFTADTTPQEIIEAARWPSEVPVTEAPSASTASVAPSDFPALTVTTVNDPAPGRIYLANLAFNQQIGTTPYLMVLDNDAVPLFRERKGQPAFDFKRQANGTVTYYDTERSVYVILDSTYAEIGTVNIGSGYQTDVHELLVLPNGNVLIMGLAPRRVDLSGIVTGGRKDAIVLDMVIQELEADGTVVFEWRSVDHFAVTDATYEDLTAETVDHVHPNSLDVDTDGNLLLSSRHLDEVTKISRTTGAIIWRLGGKNNQFTFTNDPDRFSYQHDARRVANGNILLFDNGNHHPTPHSRAVEYRLDETAMTATVAWQFRHTPEIYSYAMGNAQRLPNGNTMIGWGANNTITEVRPDGAVAFEMTMPNGVFTYRAFRLPASWRVTTELVSPAADTLDIELAPELIWERTGGARAYHVQLATDAAFERIVHEEVDLAATSTGVPVLMEWTQYFWRVRAIGDEIDGAWSPARSFTTGGVPHVLTLVAPPQGSTNLTMAPALRWAPFAGATSYDVQLSANDMFFNDPVVDTTVAGSILWLEAIGAGDRYYWRVRPNGASGTGNWSQVWDFRTAAEIAPALPERITPVLPALGSTIGAGAIRFLWQSDTSTSLFRLLVAANPSIDGGPMDDGVLVDTTVASLEAITPAGALTPGMYWWVVRATNALGEQFTSPVGSFTVDATIGVVAERAIVGASSLTPNPAGSSALLSVTLARATDMSVRIVDLSGTTVAVPFAGAVRAGTQRIGLRLDELAAGMYLCLVTTPEGATTHRLAVVR